MFGWFFIMSDFKDFYIVIIGVGMGGFGVVFVFVKKGFKNIDVYEMVLNLGFVGVGI